MRSDESVEMTGFYDASLMSLGAASFLGGSAIGFFFLGKRRAALRCALVAGVYGLLTMVCDKIDQAVAS